MEQAGLYDFVIESMGINEEMEKFAELIVEECANICFLNRHYSGAELSDMIRHRLGAEE
jgi:hypothetical protein